MQIREILVVGAGSAGLLAALALKRRIPSLKVRVVASSQLGIIRVGESTVPYVPDFIHNYLGIDEHDFYSHVDPVYKLGIRFTWGKRDYFDYSFSRRQWNWKYPDLPKTCGFYAELDHVGIDLPSALMEHGKALPVRGASYADVPAPGKFAAWHLENHRFVAWLARACKAEGIKFIDSEIVAVERSEDGGVSALRLANGAALSADLFVDSSGFRSELLGKALEEPFISFKESLFCDRAVVGGWETEEHEPIFTYTGSDTMNAGWCWRIDHPERVNRGYVFCSDHLDNAAAEEEFIARNPRIDSTFLVKFRSGRHRNCWAHNVVAVGNAAAFVEPLEATAIMSACLQIRWLVDGLIDSRLQPSPSLIRLYNRFYATLWDEIREFIAIHYKVNDRLDNPFWQRCRRETQLGHSAELLDFYRENGPSGIGEVMIPKDSPFGLDGYYAILVGMRAPRDLTYQPTPAEVEKWKAHLGEYRRIATAGLTMQQVRKQLLLPETWRKIRNAA